MSCYLRIVVDQSAPGHSRQVGLFTAAYHLRDEVELRKHDRVWLYKMLGWFSECLPVPPVSQIPVRAIFWYRQDSPIFKEMWRLAKLLRYYHYSISLVKTFSPGNVVYQDEHQIAAVPRRRNRR